MRTILILLTLTACINPKIYEVNERVNRYNYIPDDTDYMKTPAQFYQDGGGDCEDFANAKRFALIKEGIPAESMRLVQVPVSFPESHVMLEVDGYLLDNRTNKIIPAKRRRVFGL